MKVIRVFDPAMCCSTGVCGPTVDPKLVRFAADLEWLAGQGVEVRRYNLAQEPAAFVANEAVKAALSERGDAALPAIEVDGVMRGIGVYPSREELATWAGVLAAPSLYSEAVAELVAIGAAIAANCEVCFKHHYGQALKLGVSREDMMRAVRTAQSVKEAPAKKVMELAERYLRPREVEPEKEPVEVAREAGCEGPKASGSPFKIAPAKTSCC